MSDLVLNYTTDWRFWLINANTWKQLQILVNVWKLERILRIANESAFPLTGDYKSEYKFIAENP